MSVCLHTRLWCRSEMEAQNLIWAYSPPCVFPGTPRTLEGPGFATYFQIRNWEMKALKGKSSVLEETTPRGFLGTTGSHLTPQWAAVATQSSLMREPPQKWKPVLS